MRLAALLLSLTLFTGAAFGQQQRTSHAPTVSEGLSLKLTITPRGFIENDFTIELQNTSNAPLAVPLGMQFWGEGAGHALTDNLQLIGVTPDGVRMILSPLDGPRIGGIGGNAQPIVVTLTAKASYIMRRPIKNYAMYAESVPGMTRDSVHNVRVHAELRAHVRSCSPSWDRQCEPDQLVNCWNGVISSNTVEVR